ncbi:MAG: carboxypeptidase regulatory-like domain-containing protein, partial [Phycisphaerales bacterium]
LVNARALRHVENLEKGLTITGRVLDERGHPIAEAAVMLEQFSYSRLGTLTDASGAFRLTCSSDRSVYREAPALIVEAPGYAPLQKTIDLEPDPEPLEFRLQRGRSIACQVADKQGQPVVGAWTVVEPLPDNRDYSVWLKDTDDRGKFQIPNVPQNDVKLTVGRQGYIAIRDRIISESEDEVLVTMQRALRVHGTVTDAETGKAIPNFEIAEVYESGGRTRTGNPVTFANGTYKTSFDEASPEMRQLQVTAVGYESTTSGQIKNDDGEREINFKLTRSTSYDKTTAGRPREQVQPTGPRRITGIVRDEQGKPVPDAIVRTCPQRGAETVTDAKGTFTLKLMRRPGSMGAIPREETMYLLVRHKERNLATAVELDPTADKIDVTLTPGAILSGKVVDAEGQGIPSAELSLTFWISNTGYGSREVTEIDDTGHYEIRAIPSGHKYSVNASAEGYGRRYVRIDTGGAANQRLEVEPLILSVANLSVSGIVVDDIEQPVSNIRIYAYGNGQPSRETFTDTKGRFTIVNVCPGELNIQANSQDRAARRYHGRTRAEGGAKNIKIVVYEMDQRGRPVPVRPPSLLGKALPDLKALGINRLPAELTGKRVLVCFWDMNQRPSRHCMTRIAKQIEALKSKGIVVIAVQASKVDQNVLDGWAKKYNIPVSAMVGGDDRKIRFSWGVQSLPWLILTDSQHVVTAEGFRLSEL